MTQTNFSAKHQELRAPNDRSPTRQFFIKSRTAGIYSIVNFTSLIYILVLFFTFKDLYSQMQNWVVYTHIVGVLIIIINVFVLKKTDNVPQAATVMLLCMFAILMANVTFAGGIDTIQYAWIFIFPVLAGGTMGWKGQVFFWFISVTATIYYYIWPAQIEALPYEGDLAYTLLTRLLSLTIFSLIMLTYHFTLNEKMLSLRKAFRLASFEADLFSGVFNSKAQSVLLIDEHNNIKRANKTTHKIFGIPNESLINTHISNLCGNSMELFATDKLNKSLKETKLQTQDNRFVWVEYSSVAVFDENERKFMLLTIEDITKRKLQESEWDHLAHFDYLTQMPNRLMIQEHLTDLLTHNYNEAFAVIFIDLDKFKDLNDMYGHEAGDFALIEISQRLKACIRDGDFIGRFGGDEFILLTKINTYEQEIVSLVKTVQQAILHPICYHNRQHTLGASIGIAQYPYDSSNANDLLRKADAAMYKAKSAQKGDFEFYNQDYDAELKRKLRLNSDLSDALAKDELFLVYQPIFNDQSQITGAEALLRWEHSQLGFISPCEFIPIAEDGGHIVPIGDWVIEQACETLRIWHDMGHTNLTMSVNISYCQLVDNRLIDVVRKCLNKHGLPGNSLVLELTERVFADDLSVVRDSMTLLSELGVKTAIDDFGIEYSSLSYLRSVNFSILKIDRDFVTDINVDKEAENLCSAIHSMAKSLNLEVTAEGIETEAHMKLLIAMGVDKFQGYFLSKPLLNNDFKTLLR